VGALAALSLLALPAARRSLDAAGYIRFLENIQRRLDPLSWFCLVLLVGTGLFQMSASPQYEGFLAIANRWATAILIKHLLIGGMVAASAWLTWGVLPGLRRAALRISQGKDSPDAEKLRRQEERLLKLNLFLAALVLLLTALARSS
jgi:uncharacterized membrane protein